MMAQILAEPLWLVVWVLILMIANTASVLFVKRVEARWVLLAWVINLPLMGFLYQTFGYVRLLGLSHVILWTPLVIYLWMRRTDWMPPRTLADRWVVLVFTVNLLSLLIDYIDVFRWVSGERGAL
jgi:hypothetical protein